MYYSVPDKILQTLLSVYMMDTTICLPTLEEALICGENTTEEEVCLSTLLENLCSVMYFASAVARVEKLSGLPLVKLRRHGSTRFRLTYRQFTSLNCDRGILVWCVV